MEVYTQLTLLLIYTTLITSIYGYNDSVVHNGRQKFNLQEGLTGYIAYHPGTIPLILTAPHGGYMEPADIPDRGYGCWDGIKCLYTHYCGQTDDRYSVLLPYYITVVKLMADIIQIWTYDDGNMSFYGSEAIIFCC